MKKNSFMLIFAAFLLNACSTCADCNNGECDKYYSLWCNQQQKTEVKQQKATSVPIIIAPKEPTIIVKKSAYKVSETPTIVDNNIKYYVAEQNPSCISESASIKAPLVDKNVQVDDDDYKAFASRVSMIDSTSNAAGYQYRDVRVDEIMPLAARYCREHGNRRAILRKINLYHGYYRRISFDCVNL